MKKSYLKLITCFALFTFSYAASANDLFSREKAPDLPVLSTVANTNTVGGYPIPNIGYEYKFGVSNLTYSTGTGSGVPLGTLSLLSMSDNKYILALDIKGNLSEISSVGDWTDEPCKREDFIYKRSIGGKFKNINCFSINHHVNFFRNPKGKYQQLLRELKILNIEIPSTVIAAQFTRYTDRGRRLQYTFYFNPEYFGLKPETETIWGANGWHKSVINNDDNKVKFIETIKNWGEVFQDNLDNAFNKESGTYSNGPLLKSYFDMKKQMNKAQETADDTQKKLRELKDLLEKNLIPKEIYDEKVRSILQQ